jgi:superfamily II DNA or RNA helicase
MQDLKKKELRSGTLGRIIRARQRIELLKVPTFVDIAEEGLDNGFSVVIFVNYKETMYQLCQHLNTACIIHGEQTQEERDENIDSFQTNKSHIIIANINAGGVGISLHDLNGRQRMSIISPTWSGIQMQQAFGRINRAGAKSPAIQKVVYCAQSYEERICDIIKEKLRVLSAINDADLAGPNIEVEEFNKHNQTKEGDSDVIWKNTDL